MCSRYFLDADGNIIAYTFRVPVVKDHIRKRFNIAPTQEAPVVRVNREGEPGRVPGMGIEFVNFDEESMTLIQEICTTRSSPRN